MRIYVTDLLGRPANFNGIDWFMTSILHSSGAPRAREARAERSTMGKKIW